MAASAPVDMEAVRALIRARSPFDAEETERLLATRFAHVPRRLEAALERWPLREHAVLDVGCNYGMCLVHFGQGSIGVDNSARAVRFTTAIGLDAVQLDVEEGLDALPRRSYDFVWVSDILEHLDAPRRLLRALAPLVDERGRLLLQSSVLPRPRFAAAVLRRLGERPFDAEVHYQQWTVDTLRHLVARAGYRTVRVVSLLPVPASLSSRVIVEAVPDPGLLARVSRAEARNHAPDAV